MSDGYSGPWGLPVVEWRLGAAFDGKPVEGGTDMVAITLPT